MGLRLQRHLGVPSRLDPGQYCVVVTEAIAGVSTRVVVRCPYCGGTDELGAKHVIHRGTGKVEQAWRCPTETCAFHEYLELDGWEGA